MLKNYSKYLFFIFVISFLFFLNSSFAFALEAKYPPILGLSVTNGSGLEELEEYVAYFFGLAIALAGFVAVVSLAVAGVKFIISGDNPILRKDAIDDIKGAALGLILIIASFMILRTINTTLVTPSLTPLPSTEGIFYTNGLDLKPAPMSESNTSNAPAGYGSVAYKCKNGPELFVWQFPEANFSGTDDAFVETLKCGEETVISGAGSFKMAFKTPGIYYFLKGDCKGYMSNANLSNGQLSDPFKGNVKSIKIINNMSGDDRYGAIFHGNDDPARAGFCTLPFLVNDINKAEDCFTGIPASSSVEIFTWNGKTPETSGAGVDFYSEPWGQSIGARAGKYFLSNKDANNKYWNYWDDDAQNLVFNYSGINRPAPYKQLYQNFSQHPGSINIKGNYLVMLSSSAGQNQFCQTFYKDIPNLNVTEFFASGNKINIIDVIPIK